MIRRSFKHAGMALLVAISALVAGWSALRPSAQPADPGVVATQYYAALKAGDLGAALKFVRGGGQVKTVAQILAMLQDSGLFGSRPGNVPGGLAQGRLTQCKSNVRNLATALEMYSTDNAGRFPRDLAKLVPLYLRTMPTCPSAKRDTYSPAFQSSSHPDAYTVTCGGKNHADAGLAADFPQYTSTEGLVAREATEVPVARQAIWTVDSVRVLEQKVQGERATVRVDETYAVYGYPTHVLVELPLRREGGEWKVDFPPTSGDALVATLKEVARCNAAGAYEQRDAAAVKLQRMLTMNGMGWTVAVLQASPDQLALSDFLVQAQRRDALTACKSNLKNTGTALEMYCTDNAGLYPRSLALLTPNYLRRIPTCPAAGSDTYSSGFKSRSRPDVYTVVCTGSHHSVLGIPENHPQYTSNQGLICPEIKGEARP